MYLVHANGPGETKLGVYFSEGPGVGSDWWTSKRLPLTWRWAAGSNDMFWL